MPDVSVSTCGGDHGFRHHVPVIASRFRPAGQRLFWGRGRMFGDRIELTGWSPAGHYHRCIPLAEIGHLESSAHQEPAHLTLFLTTDEKLILYMKDAFLWRTLFENWLRYDTLPSARLIDDQKATALAG